MKRSIFFLKPFQLFCHSLSFRKNHWPVAVQWHHKKFHAPDKYIRNVWMIYCNAISSQYCLFFSAESSLIHDLQTHLLNGREYNDAFLLLVYFGIQWSIWSPINLHWFQVLQSFQIFHHNILHHNLSLRC